MKPIPSQNRIIPTGLFAGHTYQVVYNAIVESGLINQPPYTLRRVPDRYAVKEVIPASQYLSALLRRSNLAKRIHYGSGYNAYRNYIHGPILREACNLLSISQPTIPARALQK